MFVAQTKNRPVLILTGASRGIGHATVKLFSESGWRVITCARQPFSENCPWEGGPEDHVVVDLSDRKVLQEGIVRLRQHLDGQPLRALVNNAGVSPKSKDNGRLDVMDTDIALWDQVFQVNFFAPVMLARGLIDELRRSKASIVNVTSIAGSRVHPYAGTAYASSKAALSALTREMAADFGPLGIRVNAIAPGEIKTPMLSPGTEGMTHKLPLRRLGTPGEVAHMIYFLCSDEASYITGAEIPIDGGEHV